MPVVLRERVANATADATGKLKLEEAVARAPVLGLDTYNPPRPSFSGTRVAGRFPAGKAGGHIDWDALLYSRGLAANTRDSGRRSGSGEASAHTVSLTHIQMLDKIIK